MDPLSDVLRFVRLDGAFFYAVEAAEPWSVETLPARDLVPRIMPAADHLIPYHILTAGHCWAGLVGEEQIELVPGDVIAFPHGDAHVVSSGRGTRIGDDVLRTAPTPYPFTVRLGEDGPAVTSLFCGFLACDRRPFNPLIDSLPRQMHLPGVSNEWLSGFTRQLTEESRVGRPGIDCVITRLAELLFIQALRRHLETLPQQQTGWLAALRDPVVGRALALLHGNVARAWTVAELAHATNASRSTFASRFTRFVGQPPLHYLAQWRMQVASNLLAQTERKVAAIGIAVGYQSEAAFSRAFSKATGLAPGAWRESRRGALT